jgi:ComF family protein
MRAPPHCVRVSAEPYLRATAATSNDTTMAYRSLLAAIVGTVVESFLDFMAPRLCPACDQPLEEIEQGYCDACRASLEPAPFPRELYGELSSALGRDELVLAAVGALYTFTQDGPVQRLVHAVKYLGCYDLGVALGRDLGRATTMFVEFDAIDCVVPVPLHAARRRERGYNQAEAIARGVAAARGIELLPDAIERGRHTRSQTRLGAGARMANVASTFVAGRTDVRGRTVLVCDDVCTTGATLNACAETLVARGARAVCAATVARDLLMATSRRDPISPALVGLG